MVELQKTGFTEALIPLLPDDFELTAPAAWGAVLADALATDGVFGLLAHEDGGDLIGLAVYGLNRDYDPASGAGELRALFVAPTSWRQGVGRALVEKACGHLAELGYSAVTLWSLRDNAGANAFYRRLRFVADGATQVRDRLGAPEVRYARRLVPRP